MRKTIITCDICQKEIKHSTLFEIPIIVHGEQKDYLKLQRFDDLCDDCMNDLGNTMSKKYYEMCRKYNSTGMHGVVAD